MPLKVVRRKDTGTWSIVGTVKTADKKQGIRIRRRAGSDNLKLAKEEAASLEAAVLKRAWHGDKPGDDHTFFEAADAYLTHERRSKRTEKILRRLLLHFGDVPLADLTQTALQNARKAMFAGPVSPNTTKRELFTPLKAVLTFAAHQSRKWCELPQFDVPKEKKARTELLLPAEFEALRAEAAPHLKPLLTFLVCTGCRMSEALTLQWRDVDLVGQWAILWEGETKSGNRRVVELSPAATHCLAELGQKQGHVFLTQKGRPYRDSETGGGQIKTAWATARRKADIGKYGPHDLRHTWASWHYAMHRDLLRLKTEGGWSSVSLVERYAHIMPAGHEVAIRAVWSV